MLGLAFGILCATALIGAVLAFRYFSGMHAPLLPAAVHALLGSAGFAVLIVALRRTPPASGMGTAGFGAIASWLLAAALLFGMRLAYLAWRRRRPSEAAVGLHMAAAIAGLVVLLALVSLS